MNLTSHFVVNVNELTHSVPSLSLYTLEIIEMSDIDKNRKAISKEISPSKFKFSSYYLLLKFLY